MTSIILWKEYREHRAIWIALAVLAVGVLVGIPLVVESATATTPSFREALGLIGVLFAWMYGLVCGAMLFAAERENRTDTFLDGMPVTKRALWVAKCFSGVVFVGLYFLFVGGLIYGNSLFGESTAYVVVIGLIYFSFLGLGWGVTFSAWNRSKSVLGAITIAIVAQLVFIPFCFLLVGLLSAVTISVFDFHPRNEVAFLLASALGLLLPWPMSYFLFCDSEGERDVYINDPEQKSIPIFPAWRTAFQLSFNQVKIFSVGILAFSLFSGFAVAGKPLLLWPIFSLIVGAVCGATIFMDEQAGAYRFLGDQRFPLTQLWIAKLILRFGLLLLGLGVMLAPAYIVAINNYSQRPHAEGILFITRVFRSHLVGTTLRWDHLLIAPAITGVAVGHLAGILFRKTLVAIVVSVGSAAILLALWLPSLIMGGVHLYQLYFVPLLLLITSGWILRNWVTDRLASGSTLSKLAFTSVLGIAGLVLGIGCRIWEVAEVPEPDGLKTFLSTMPSFDENKAGNLLRSTLTRLEQRQSLWLPAVSKNPIFPTKPSPALHLSGQATEVMLYGWPDIKKGQPEPELAVWLKEVFKEDLWAEMREATKLPVGVIEDPRRLKINTPLSTTESARTAGSFLVAHGLMMQKLHGKPEVFVEHLDVGLNLVRNLQNHAPLMCAIVARAIEGGQVQAVEHWLRELKGRPDLLKRVLAILNEHRKSIPATETNYVLAQYIIAKESLKDPTSWLQISPMDPDNYLFNEVEVYSFCSLIPWEEVRQERLLRLMFAYPDSVRGFVFPDLRILVNLAPIRSTSVNRHNRRMLRLDMARLQVALRLYQEQHKKPAQQLRDLVPTILESIPLDPFDLQPLRYRLSKGEKILLTEEWDGDVGAGAAGGAGMAGPGMMGGPPGGAPGGGMPIPPGQLKRTFLEVKPGQGVLWSVGDDRVDNHATRQGWNDGPVAAHGEDLIFLVPLPPN